MKISLFVLNLIIAGQVFGQSNLLNNQNEEYYKIVDVPIPSDIVLEVGGLSFNDQGQLGVATRRGDIWLIDKPYSKEPFYNLFASGLHEPLGLSFKENAFYTVQRGELTKLIDDNNDNKADIYQTIASWPLSGNYHEYSYGPLFLPNGEMIVALNVGWNKRGVSLVKWRGWMLKIAEDGEITPFAMGLRSPAGMGMDIDGSIFYAENQGDWVGSGRITHVEEGDFLGHPASLKWSSGYEPTIDMLSDDFEGYMYDYVDEIPNLKLPSIWFPHTIMGISTSDILLINNNDFGPFKGQMLVGDQGQMKIMRVYLDKVNGQYQGACFPFREGFSSGILRMIWGNDNSLFVGMTSRGWKNSAKKSFALERLIPTGKIPFEMKSVKLVNDGFEIEFTDDVNSDSANKASAYKVTNFTYNYHRKYGSPIAEKKKCHISKVELKDKKTVYLKINGLRKGFIHEIKLGEISSENNESLLHNVAYYTLNEMREEVHTHTYHEVVTDCDETEPSCGADRIKNLTTKPKAWNNVDHVIHIGTKPGLKYDIEEFEVAVGSRVELTFENKDDMLHNLLVTKVGEADIVGELALNLGLDGMGMGFVPESESVLFYTCVLQPDSEESIFFIAPERGEYPFLCTLPGHHKVMRGTMKVK